MSTMQVQMHRRRQTD